MSRRLPHASILSVSIVRRSQRLLDERSVSRATCPRGRAALHVRGDCHIVPVLDISSQGLLVRTALHLRIGERVAIQRPGKPAGQGIVRWYHSGRAGIELV